INQVDQASLGNGRYFPFTTLSFDCDYSGNGSSNITATDFIYDTTTGNLTNKIQHGKVTGFSPTSTDGFSYSDSDPIPPRCFKAHFTAIPMSTNILDHPDKVTLTDTNGNIFQETDYSYNSQSGTLSNKLTRISSGHFATNSI